MKSIEGWKNYGFASESILRKNVAMSEWFYYAIAAAMLYGLHQVFTKLASERIGGGVGGFIVEGSAALIIALYLLYLKFFGEWKQPRGSLIVKLI